MSEKMKAAVIQDVGDLQFVEFDVPKPAAYEFSTKLKPCHYVQLNNVHILGPRNLGTLLSVVTRIQV